MHPEVWRHQLRNDMVETSPQLKPAQPNRLRFFPQLNHLSDQRWLRSNVKLCQKTASVHFGSDSLQDTLIRAIADQRILSIKEVMETFEFFARTRKATKADLRRRFVLWARAAWFVVCRV